MEIEVKISDRFIEDSQQIYSKHIAKTLERAIQNITFMPTCGSKIVALSLKSEFGEDVYKYLVGPFDLIYSYSEEKAVVELHALIDQRQVR